MSEKFQNHIPISYKGNESIINEYLPKENSWYGLQNTLSSRKVRVTTLMFDKTQDTKSLRKESKLIKGKNVCV